MMGNSVHNSTPTNQVANAEYYDTVANIIRNNGVDSLTPEQKTLLAKGLGMSDPATLDPIGRIEWAATIERRLENGWALYVDHNDPLGFGGPGICMS